MYSSAYVWAKVLSHMEEQLGPVVVSAAFDDAEVVELNETNLILYSPSDFRREVIRRRYTHSIEDALKEVFNSDAKLSTSLLESVEAASHFLSTLSYRLLQVTTGRRYSTEEGY